MRIAILQTSPILGEKELNLRDLDNLIGGGDGSDIYIVPEMFNTALVQEAALIAEPMDGETIQWMKQKAANLNAAVMGSLAICEDNKVYNRLCFVKPDGEVEYYDKRHLFTYAGEGKYITPGYARKVVTFRGLRIMLQVCYDLRFPIWARNRGDYDMILYVASWPTPRIAAWSALLVARAIENQCYVAGVNRVGTDPTCEYNGASVVVDPYGKVIAECALSEECEATTEIDMEVLEAFREKFPVLKDADI